MKVKEHVTGAARAEFCREYLRAHSRVVKREIARRQARAEVSRLAHLALLREGVRS